MTTESMDPHPKPRKKRARRLAPDLWVSLRPNGIGLQKPNHFGEMARTVWDNKQPSLRVGDPVPGRL